MPSPRKSRDASVKITEAISRVARARIGERMFELCGALATVTLPNSLASIGRGAFYNPWVFQHTLHYLRTGELLPEPSFEARVEVMCRHFDLMISIFGEDLGCRMFRKVGPWYSKRFGPANEFNKAVVLVASREQFYDIVAKYRTWRAQFLDEAGELMPRFQPMPMVPSFMAEPGQQRTHIPVPIGPVEVW